ncbi:MAG TPA: aminotransferase class V-fold PLP-dependent enzyme, partial [Verrucomicrobiales bacterium]|nr:aminotransferase class V-fold PLP-dependent enzyme [Verrucomicrobiales bacterium]
MIPSQVFSAYPREDFRAHEAGIRDAMDRVLTGSSYILGPEVSTFESEFADWIGARHAVGVANGTDAIELLLRAHGIGPGDQVAVPSHTAVASVSAIERAGAGVVLVDIDPVSRTIDAATLGTALDREDARTVKAVLAVHLYGHPAPMTSLQAFCRNNGLLLLEDCAQAHGAEWEGRRVGVLADGGAFSFYPTKNLGAIGDGGAVCTNDDGVAERLRWLRQYGWAERYVSHVSGINSRLDELQAALLRVKL